LRNLSKSEIRKIGENLHSDFADIFMTFMLSESPKSLADNVLPSTLSESLLSNSSGAMESYAMTTDSVQ